MGPSRPPLPAWEKATGNHQSPNAAAVDATGLYRQGSVNEGGHWAVKTDLNGRALWVNDRNQADPWMGGGDAIVTIDELRIFGHALAETEVIRLSD